MQRNRAVGVIQHLLGGDGRGLQRGFPVDQSQVSSHPVLHVSAVMCSASACEHCWSVEGWIHSERKNRLDQKLVEKLVRTHTNLVLRESLDDTLLHLLPWDIEFVIDETVDDQEEQPEV